MSIEMQQDNRIRAYAQDFADKTGLLPTDIKELAIS